MKTLVLNQGYFYSPKQTKNSLTLHLRNKGYEKFIWYFSELIMN